MFVKLKKNDGSTQRIGAKLKEQKVSTLKSDFRSLYKFTPPVLRSVHLASQ